MAYKIVNNSQNEAVSLSVIGSTNNLYTAINIGPGQSLTGDDLLFNNYEAHTIQAQSILTSLFGMRDRGILSITKDGNPVTPASYKQDQGG